MTRSHTADRQYLWERAERIHQAQQPVVEMVERPWGVVPRINPLAGGARCNVPKVRAGSCRLLAGANTGHLGTGACGFHRGNTPRGNMEGWMVMAHALGTKMQVAPEVALRDEVERTAGGVAWLDAFLQSVDDPAELLPSGKYGEYTELWQKERAHLVRATTAAVNAGIMARIAIQEDEIGAILWSVLNQAARELHLPAIDEQRLLELVTQKVLALGSE